MVQHVDDVVKVAGQMVDRATLTGLKTASAKSGVSFQYLVAKAAQESSLQPDAQAATSSAKGLFQFTRGTWLDMMQRFGDRYGYGALAENISTTADGRTAVKDPAVERRILELRQDPEASALMAAEYARGNAASLHDALGRGPDAPDLYLAHFLGPNGASRLLTAAEESPDTAAADLLPAAAKANTSVFYAADGTARTAVQVVDLIRARFAGQMDRYSGVASAMAEQDTARAVTGGREWSAPTKDFKVMDFRTNLNGSNSYAMAVSWMVLEEMANLIANSPMTMLDGEENEDSADKDPYAASSPGFQGQDMANALLQALRPEPATQKPGAAPRGAPDHQRGAAAYLGGIMPRKHMDGTI